jgi:hypothetical protein
MAGTRTGASKVAAVLRGYSNAAVTANQYLTEEPVLFPARIGAVKVRAETAGSGVGSTVVDVLLNGASVYTTAGNRPTIAAASTGEATNTRPNAVSVQPGDVLAWRVISVPAGSGHARVSAACSLEVP